MKSKVIEINFNDWMTIRLLLLLSDSIFIEYCFCLVEYSGSQKKLFPLETYPGYQTLFKRTFSFEESLVPRELETTMNTNIQGFCHGKKAKLNEDTILV